MRDCPPFHVCRTEVPGGTFRASNGREQKAYTYQIKSNTVAVYYRCVPWFWEANEHDDTIIRQERGKR